MENQNEFKGWAKVEVMGHQSHVGYVTTETFGSAVLFRIDQPRMESTRETLESAAWIGDVYAGIGSEVERAEIEPSSVLVGSASIYRIIPCDELTARLAIRKDQKRPLMIVKLAAGKLLSRPAFDEIDERDEEN
jgi:hypothetical protein